MEQVATKREEEQWLPSAGQMLMETEKARFKVETEERRDACLWVGRELLPRIKEAVSKGDTNVKVSCALSPGCIRHILDHLTQQGYDASLAPMNRAPWALPAITVEWGKS